MKIRLFYRIITALFLLLFVSLISTCSPNSVKVPLSKDVITGVLPNGLRYYIQENPFPKNMATLGLVVNAGSVLEREEQRGFAHFVEHMAFNGTEKFPSFEMVDYLRSMGMRFGYEVNAYTSYDDTIYFFDIPLETEKNNKIPDKALAILDDWTHAVSFIQEDIDDEKGVILEEFRSHLGVGERTKDKIFSTILKDSAYLNRDPLGLEQNIKDAVSEQLKEFYDRWYTNDNMALVFVGDFDGKELETELKTHFNKSAPEKPVNRPRYELPPPKKGNFNIEIITDPEAVSAQFMIYYNQKNVLQKDTIEYYRQTLMEDLIETMIYNRLEEKRSNPDSAVSSSYGYFWRWIWNLRFFYFEVEPKTGKYEEALKELLLEKESIKRFGFTKSELKRAKSELISKKEILLAEKDKTESKVYLENIANHFIYGESIPDIEWELNTVNLLLPKINSKEITKKINKYLSYNDINIFLVAPQSELDNLPSKERIKEIYKETQKQKIVKRTDDDLSGELLKSVPSKGNILSEIIDIETGAVTLTMSNGAKVILKETENRNNEILMYAMAKGGKINAEKDAIVSVNLLSEMIDISGLGPYSRTELSKKISGKQTEFYFWQGNYTRGFQGSSVKQEIKTLFEIINLFFSAPRLDERMINVMIDQYKTNLKYENEDPENIFYNEIMKIINGNNEYFKPLEPADMEKVSFEKAWEYLYNCLNTSDYTFIFTGNINTNEIKELCEIYIASLPENKSMNSWKNPGIVRPQEGRTTISKGMNEKCMVYLGWFADGSSVFVEQKNQTGNVLNEYLNIILINEIREKLGGIYSIRANVSAYSIPQGENKLEIYFDCNPAGANELITAVQKTLTEIAFNSINTQIFNKAKEALIMEHEREMQSNFYITKSYADSSVLYNTSLNRLNLTPDTIKAVTPGNMQTLCREILASGAIQLVLKPER